MEQAVLRMPPELWRDNCPIDTTQRHAHYVAAADKLLALRAMLSDLLAAHDRRHAWFGEELWDRARAMLEEQS
jgi:hypothetical protein